MMPIDYESLHNSRDFEGELQRAIGLIADMYGDRPTHFILELLQNADDALENRPRNWRGDRTVCFNVQETCIEVAHFGCPFDAADVKGIIVTRSSTKENDLNAIGKHGVGFKSVFNITDRPEIHSGDEDFAIEKSGKPVKVEPIQDSNPELTTFRLPLNDNGQAEIPDIISNLKDLELRTLLFLRQIDGISWQAFDGQEGKLHRKTDNIGENARKVTVSSTKGGEQTELVEKWIVLSRAVSHGDKPAGYVEIAFQLSEHENDGLQVLTDSRLTVFFPTIVETGLGLLIQGPYRTTPNRENTPSDDDWNKYLMNETAALISESLRWLKYNKLLDAKTLSGFPIDKGFEDNERYAPLYKATTSALKSQALLPCTDGNHHRAGKTRLGGTSEVRQLFTPRQLAQLYGESGHLFWITENITDTQPPNLRRYIRDELGVADTTPEALIPLLRSGRAFLESQTDEWVRGLYEFFGRQSALRDRLLDIPLLRLEDGRHIEWNGDIQAFLPGELSSRFATLRKSVCDSDDARRFLESLGLKEADLVNDVLQNILPKYEVDDVADTDYDNDIQIIVSAYANASTSRRDELASALYDVKFVKTVDAGDSSKQFAQPDEVYLADDEQKKLFADVKGILFLDKDYECLNNPEIGELLKQCGATPADDLSTIVTNHILPKYRNSPINVSNNDYEADFNRILITYEKTSNERRLIFLNSLRGTKFVRAIDNGTGAKFWCTPNTVYLATAQLKELFDEVAGVLMVNDAYDCLCSDDAVRLLEACGAARYLIRASIRNTYTPDELRNIRRNAGLEAASRSSPINGSTLKGVDELLRFLPQLSSASQLHKAALLWRSLADVVKNSGYSAFQIEYSWGYLHERRTTHLDAEIIKQLNNAAWIPDAWGQLQLPDLVYFGTVHDTHGWEDEPFLKSKIHFKPPIISELAHATGIDEDALDLMKQHGLTADDIRKLIPEEDSIPGQMPTPPSTEPGLPSTAGGGGNGSSFSTSSGSGTGTGANSGANGDGGSNGTGTSSGSSSPNNGGTRPFYSYVGAHPDKATDPDGLKHEERMDLEEKAIQFILEQEPEWRQTPTHNPGFDLYQADTNGKQTRWCEVKAMSGTFDSRPATMTKRQFEEARQRGEAYWLYVVESAGTDSPRIIRINDPAGQARTFTFDKGWLAVAMTDEEQQAA